MRLFAAFRPDEEAREHLVQALRPIHAEFSQELRWTDPDNWHVTIAFYGEQPRGSIPDYVAQLGELARETKGPLTLNLRGAGCFNQRSLWTGIGGERVQLLKLMAGAGQLSAEEARRKRNRPHLTIARLRSSGPTWDPFLPDIVRALSVYRGPDFTIREIGLYESFLGQGRSGGPRYELRDAVYL